MHDAKAVKVTIDYLGIILLAVAVVWVEARYSCPPFPPLRVADVDHAKQVPYC
ncbi:hypothetical protein ACFYR1_46340 [Streptomyces canus]|uniref:hypothetical protein n=1 Tax=Streptomyces canus TaxID=58343 RepID=UPI00367D6928